MARPGIVLYDNPTNELLAYRELKAGAGRYAINVPCGYSPQNVYWVLVHDLVEVAGRVDAGWFDRAGGPTSPRFEDLAVRQGQVRVPRFRSLPRARNINFAAYGETTPDGLHVRTPEDITSAYQVIVADARLDGKGKAMNSYREYLYLAAGRLLRRGRNLLAGRRSGP
jgi:hypothetical protein